MSDLQSWAKINLQAAAWGMGWPLGDCDKCSSCVLWDVLVQLGELFLWTEKW
jgi:hypothetical protein